jgi:hypothetical protein
MSVLIVVLVRGSMRVDMTGFGDRKRSLRPDDVSVSSGIRVSVDVAAVAME